MLRSYVKYYFPDVFIECWLALVVVCVVCNTVFEVTHIYIC